jgi:hypothetical protein
VNLQAEIDRKGFGAVVNALSRMSGKDFEYTLKTEVGHILKGTITKLPVASVKKIVRYTMPVGYTQNRQRGNRLVTVLNGKKYHAGEPIPSTLGVRGGQRYAKPFTYWMNKKGSSEDRWGDFVAKQRQKTIDRVAKRGLTAGQIYIMAKKGSIPLPPLRNEKVFNGEQVQKIAGKKVKARGYGQQREYTFEGESVGLKLSGIHQVQKVLEISTKARIKFFVRALNNDFISDLKHYMPKNYPLLFK